MRCARRFRRSRGSTDTIRHVGTRLSGLASLCDDSAPCAACAHPARPLPRLPRGSARAARRTRRGRRSDNGVGAYAAPRRGGLDPVRASARARADRASRAALAAGTAPALVPISPADHGARRRARGRHRARGVRTRGDRPRWLGSAGDRASGDAIGRGVSLRAGGAGVAADRRRSRRRGARCRAASCARARRVTRGRCASGDRRAVRSP